MITQQQLKAALPLITDNNIKKYIDVLNNETSIYHINTPIRLAAFLAQVGHESNNFSAISENLNYSVNGLVSIFGKYFTLRENHVQGKFIAEDYARQPEKIANIEYANRLGNGDIASGDGWKYRGRGLIQITGKDMYAKYMISSHVDVVTTPDLVTTPQHAVGSACWFWDNVKFLNPIADTNTLESFTIITKKINGGTIGLDDRIAKWTTAKKALGC